MKLKFRWCTVLVLLVFSLSGLEAIELDYHFGAGISAPFFESESTIVFPSFYGGLGVNVLDQLALGAEYEMFGFYFFGYGAMVHMPRAYLKFDLAPRATFSLLGGAAFPTIFTPDESETFTEANAAFAGVKATFFFLYGEYLYLIDDDNQVSLISLGVAIKR
jgi:hypothetical protein